MRKQSKWAWAFFGLAAFFMVLGLIGTSGAGALGAGTAAREGGLATALFQIAYPAAAILAVAGLLYLIMKRTR